jgi:GNAT superfamily N-acetyltransferase
MIASDELTRRLIASDAAFTIARLGVIANRPGNPFRVATRSEGDVHAFACRGIPTASFNRVIGLSDLTADRVPSIAAWLDSAGSRGRVEVMAGWHGPALARALTAHGWVQMGFSAIAAAVPAEKAPASKLRVEMVERPAALDLFIDTHLSAWGMPQDQWRAAKENMGRWLDLDGWTMMMARVDGMPAASGVLHVSEGVGYLADAATKPQWRGRGAHTALLHERIAKAAEARCDLVWGMAAFPSVGFRNMRRAGLGMIANVAIWERLG